MNSNKFINKVVVYQTNTGAIELKGDMKKDTLWATQAQITNIFNIDRTVVIKHIGNILKNNEVSKKKQCAKNAHCKFRQSSSLLFISQGCVRI